MPLANSYLEEWQFGEPEARYPLHARVCDQCLLVQVDDVVPPESIFDDYAYFSSYSDSWVEHARRFAEKAIRCLELGPESLVIEVASNDGYLLKHFHNGGVPVLGIEPAAKVAAVAQAAGVPTETRFFGSEVASGLVAAGRQADLLVANNVLAHVPDLNDFVAGLATVLAPRGVLVIEVPHLLRLIESVQFDTIYHEHFSYFSLHTAERVLKAHGLEAFDVEQLPTHGGSLRLWVAHAASGRSPSERLLSLRDAEAAAGLLDRTRYSGFSRDVERCRQSFSDFLRAASADRKCVVAYGAAAKGNTLLNFCGVHVSDIAYVVDRSPHKQGRYLPGSHLPIRDPKFLMQTRPDYIIILPWNLRDEIIGQMAIARSWGAQFVIPVPLVEIVN